MKTPKNSWPCVYQYMHHSHQVRLVVPVYRTVALVGFTILIDAIMYGVTGMHQLPYIMLLWLSINSWKCLMCSQHCCHWYPGAKAPGGRFKNTYELLNLRALKISKLHKNHIFQCMGKIFCVEFQRVPLKFHAKYLTHTLKDVDFIHIWKFKSS